jgi:2-methylcitrate dehydratase
MRNVSVNTQMGSDPSINSNERRFSVDQIASFSAKVQVDDIQADVMATLKRNTLDSIASAVAALGGEPDLALRDQFREYGGSPTCTLIGGGRAAPDQAAFLNSVLVRYVDTLDTYMAPGGLCHPSDNFGAILAAAEMANASGRDFLLALAIAYEVQCRFSEAVPVMFRGLNHALQLSMSVAAGASRLLGLDAKQTANAIAIAAADNVSLAAVHAEPVSHWKALSPGISAMRALYATSLAKRDITGPRGLVEGPNGLNRLFDQDIQIDWSDFSLNSVTKTVLKKYCALIHGQTAIETVLTLKKEHGIEADQVANVIVDIFRFAYEIAGGGQFGDKNNPQTKEQADYNLKYLVAAALLDGEVGPAQLDAARIQRPDTQDLLKRVLVRADPKLTERYPHELPVRISIMLRDGRELKREQADYEGSITRPLSWERVVEKFRWLSEPFVEDALQDQIIAAVLHLDRINVSELMRLLAKVSPKAVRPRRRPAV